jgi:hypothetical protein
LEPMSSPPPGFFARLVAKLRRYAARVRDSREELSQAGADRPLPPIPPDERHSKR